MTLHYFAYGSNMSVPRLRGRVPEAEPLGMGILPGHVLRFHKRSFVDGSAKCDAWYTGSPQDRLHGVLFALPASRLEALDRAEGCGNGYERQEALIHLADHSTMQAFFYAATAIDPGLLPFTWYVHHVLAGAREAGLPESCIAAIEQVRAIRDPDREREARELAIHGF